MRTSEKILAGVFFGGAIGLGLFASAEEGHRRTAAEASANFEIDGNERQSDKFSDIADNSEGQRNVALAGAAALMLLSASIPSVNLGVGKDSDGARQPLVEFQWVVAKDEALR